MTEYHDEPTPESNLDKARFLEAESQEILDLDNEVKDHLPVPESAIIAIRNIARSIREQIEKGEVKP